jgi:flavin reductase (DIM6/NTAB) family NADH-FMN oxidoreductase RutF
VSALTSFPYGLYVVTVARDGAEHGMTASWVTQTAAAPPMVAVAIANSSETIEMIREARRFGVSLLSQGQHDVAAKLPGRLKGIRTRPAPAAQTPVLADALGWVECRVVATLPSGDHTLVLGEVIATAVEQDGKPLMAKDA